MLTFKPKYNIVHEFVNANSIEICVFWILILFDEFPSINIYICLPFIDLICLFFPHFLNDLPYAFLDLFLGAIILLIDMFLKPIDILFTW